MKQYDVVIIGAGIVGLSLAAALGEQKLNVLVLDAQQFSVPTPGQHARVSAINHTSERILSSLGVWQLIDETNLSPFRKIAVWDRQGKGEIDFDSTDRAEPYLGHIVPNHEIQSALLKRVKQLNTIELIAPVSVEAITINENDAEIKVANQKISAKLVVGADGVNSWVRKNCGFDCAISPYEQVAIVSTVKTEKSHLQTARQCFLPNGPLAFLPLKDLHTSSIVWATTAEESEKILAMNEHDFLAHLTQSFEAKLGVVTERLDVPKKFPLVMRHAKTYVKPRVTLAGDAAHSIHPLAGQGLNMGILDVACLAEIIISVTDEGRDIGLIHHLKRYERWRRGDNWAMIGAMSGFRQLFGSSNEFVTDIRSAGLNLVNNISFLKKQFIRYAMGDRIRLPQLAK